MYPEFKATERYEMIETNIPANSGATRFNFADQPQLRTDQSQDVIIQGLEVFDVVDVPLSPNNVAVVSSANLKQTYIVLYVDGEESIYRIPLTKLKVANNFAGPYNAATANDSGTVAFRNLQVDWTKSYFFTPAAYAAGVFATFSFLLGVTYKKLPPSTMGKLKQNEYVGYCNIKVASMSY